MRRYAVALRMMLVWLLSSTAPSIAAEGDAVLRVGLASMPSTLDPALVVDGPAALVGRQVFDTLVQYRDGSSEVEPGLATQWTPSKDGLVWTFRLREGVRFHDGTLLTAQHVAASIERQLFPGQPNSPAGPAVAPRLFRGAPGVVKEIRVADSRTLRIHLSQPYAPLATVLAHPGLGIVLGAPDGRGQWIGTGPFSVAEMSPGRIALDANRGYWAAAPRAGRILFVEEPDESRAVAELDARNLDLWVPLGVPARMAGAVSVAGWRIGYLALQTEKEPFSRRKVRHAVATALDATQVAAAIGPAVASLQSFLPPSVWARREGPALTEGDAVKARRLLGEAGLSRSISTTLVVSGGAAGPGDEQARLAAAVSAALAPAGISVQTQAVAPPQLMQLAQNGEHQMVLMEGWVDGGDPHLLLYPLSTSEGATKGPAAWNLSFYRNARLDDLLIRASQLSFRPERQRVYARAQALLAEELPWIPLYVRRHWVVARPEVKGLRLHPSGVHRLDRVVIEPAVRTP
jgi:peptide/nickel transport system substrate-binding protein